MRSSSGSSIATLRSANVIDVVRPLRRDRCLTLQEETTNAPTARNRPAALFGGAHCHQHNSGCNSNPSSCRTRALRSPESSGGHHPALGDRTERQSMRLASTRASRLAAAVSAADTRNVTYTSFESTSCSSCNSVEDPGRSFGIQPLATAPPARAAFRSTNATCCRSLQTENNNCISTSATVRMTRRMPLSVASARATFDWTGAFPNHEEASNTSTRLLAHRMATARHTYTLQALRSRRYRRIEQTLPRAPHPLGWLPRRLCRFGYQC